MRKIKSISFNLSDETENELYRISEKTNFSSYVKRLIYHDIEIKKERLKKKDVPKNRNRNQNQTGNVFIPIKRND